jgi:hypothetical protein
LKKMVKGKIKRKGRSIVKNELSCEEMKIWRRKRMIDCEVCWIKVVRIPWALSRRAIRDDRRTIEPIAWISQAK